MVYPHNKNKEDTLFTFNLFKLLTSTCFQQVYCSSSGGTNLYIQQLVYVMLKIMELFKIKFNVQRSVHRKYILIYIQQDATLHSLFISGNRSTCFGWYLHPSSEAHTTVSAASGTCQTIIATCHYRGGVELLHDSDR